MTQFRINNSEVLSPDRLEAVEIASLICNATDACIFVYSTGQSDMTVWTGTSDLKVLHVSTSMTLVHFSQS